MIIINLEEKTYLPAKINRTTFQYLDKTSKQIKVFYTSEEIIIVCDITIRYKIEQIGQLEITNDH